MAKALYSVAQNSLELELKTRGSNSESSQPSVSLYLSALSWVAYRLSHTEHNQM